MKIAIAGTGYVGLVTGVCLSDIGHQVTCFDISEEKIDLLSKGKSPIYEPGLEELIQKNKDEHRLHFTSRASEAYADADCVFIAVGTPENEDGSANLNFVLNAAKDIAQHIRKDIVVVTKSTVPVGTNDVIHQTITQNLKKSLKVSMVSNPEFLREGSAIQDTFHGDRIVIGADNQKAGDIIEEIYQNLKLPVVRTSVRSAEMIKYASNAFLATKISFINEIANLSEKVGANIEDVAVGMGFDKRIGQQFLKAGIGYGGSCFPKDTKALRTMGTQHDVSLSIIEAVMKSNDHQKNQLFVKAKDRLGSLKNKKIAVLGLAFKPNTDDIREAPSVQLIQNLLLEDAEVLAYDPIASKNAEKVFGSKIVFAGSVEEAIDGADAAFIVTEWKQIREFPLDGYLQKMKEPILFDGRNCYSLPEAAEAGVEYHSIGRIAVTKPVKNTSI
ncbi:UDP-glucose dehydrogenase family protein [Falsibacillus pallidus]|uniref:UDP-glucose dehydrogenase family protein n=1 Tax=Falsibacillus pallidus TaxID=493781 RepID=UPI003D9936AE